MKITALKLTLFFTILSVSWINYCQADVVITNTNSVYDQKQGYIENTDIYFAVTNGQSQDISKINPPMRAMRKVDLEVNGKSIVIQNSGDNELYVKAQDQFGSIVKLEKKDYVTLQNALTNITRLRKGNTANEIHESLTAALSLLASWPPTMPVLIWQDEQQRVSAVDSDTVITKHLQQKSSSEVDQATSVDKSVLKHPDTRLLLPEIEPLQVLPIPEAKTTVTPNANVRSAQAVGALSSNSSKSLCTKMGVPVAGSYPLISPTIWYPFTKVDGIEKYTTTVGGVQCLARCGAKCVDSISGVYGLGKNAYSEDCLDHDMCVTKRGITSKYCNFIFSDASNDFFSNPCGHDLALENVVVSNNSLASSQPTTVSSKLNVFIIFTVKNNANTKLPHNQITFDVTVDGVKKTTLPLTKALNAFEPVRYFYQIGRSGSYKPGKHTLGIQIKSPTIIQTKTTNDTVKAKPFSLM
jgi:hypothetical protein